MAGSMVPVCPPRARPSAARYQRPVAVAASLAIVLVAQGAPAASTARVRDEVAIPSRAAGSFATSAANAPVHFVLQESWSGAFTSVVADLAAYRRFYAVRGQRLEVWDAADPDRPARLGATGRLGGLVRVHAAGGGLAIVEIVDAAGWTASPQMVHRLRLVDARDGSRPVATVDLPIPTVSRVPDGDGDVAAFDVALSGGQAFVAVRALSKLYVVDVATNGVLRRSAMTTLSATPAALAAGDGWLAVAYSRIVEVFAVAPPVPPVSVYQHVDPSRRPITALAVDADRLLVGAGGSLHSLALRESWVFEEIGRVAVCGDPLWAVAAADGDAAVACTRWREPGFELTAFRTASDAAPTPVGLKDGWAWDLGPHGLAIDDGVLVAAEGEGGLTVYRTVNGVWEPRHHERTLGNPSALALDGTRLWATDFDDELWAIDLADPARPALMSATDDALYGGVSPDARHRYAGSSLSSFTSALFVDRGLAYVGHRGSRCCRGSWSIVDVRDPHRPVGVGEWSPVRPDGDTVYHPTGNYAPVRSSNRLVLGGILLGLATFDVADPSRPRQMAIQWFEEGVMGGLAAGADGPVWVARDAHGLAVVDVSGAEPRDLGPVPGIERPIDVALGGERLYVGRASRRANDPPYAVVAPGGISVVDPTTRRLVATLPGPDVVRVAPAGGRALVTLEHSTIDRTHASWLRAYDVTDPAAPVAGGSADLLTYDIDPLTPLAVAGDVVVAGGGPAGVLVFRLTNRPGTEPERTAGRAYLPFGVVRR